MLPRGIRPAPRCYGLGFPTEGPVFKPFCCRVSNRDSNCKQVTVLGHQKNNISIVFGTDYLKTWGIGPSLFVAQARIPSQWHGGALACTVLIQTRSYGARVWSPNSKLLHNPLQHHHTLPASYFRSPKESISAHTRSS